MRGAPADVDLRTGAQLNLLKSSLGRHALGNHAYQSVVETAPCNFLPCNLDGAALAIPRAHFGQVFAFSDY